MVNEVPIVEAVPEPMVNEVPANVPEPAVNEVPVVEAVPEPVVPTGTALGKNQFAFVNKFLRRRY